MMRFDAVRFMDAAFGGIKGLRDTLEAHQIASPSVDTLRKWRERGQIPAAWLPILLYVLEEDTGGPVSIGPFIRGKQKTCKSLNAKPLSTGTPLSVFD